MFSYSLKEQSINPRKIYCIDTGLRNVVGFKFSEDYGRLYENIVAIELKRRMSESISEIYYWRGGPRRSRFSNKGGVEGERIDTGMPGYKGEENKGQGNRRIVRSSEKI